MRTLRVLLLSAALLIGAPAAVYAHCEDGSSEATLGTATGVFETDANGQVWEWYEVEGTGVRFKVLVTSGAERPPDIVGGSTWTPGDETDGPLIPTTS